MDGPLTLVERLERLRMRTPVDGRVLGVREWCAWLGMSEGWLSALKTRTKQGKAPSLDRASALRIQRKTGARIEWLLGETEQWERYPEREAVLAEYRALPVEVIAEVRSMTFHSQRSPSPDRWRAYIDATLAAYSRGEQMGEAVTEDDVPPEGR